MKEIERVSIGGYAFTLDQDAAALVGDYLGELERHYNGSEGGSEILEGIEERMAELLREQCGPDGVASRAAVESIIGILGRPEDIEQEDEGATQGASGTPDTGKSSDGRPKRKLYRDLSNKVVAGVCSGLGTYFDLDTALFRIIFAAGTVALVSINWSHHGSIQLLFPVIYLILWIAMPAARTVQQRWEQRGENGTIKSIQQSIERGAGEIDKAMKRASESRIGSEFSRIFEKFIGVILLIIGFAGLFTGSLWSFGSGFFKGSYGNGMGEYGLFGLGRLYGRGMAELYEYTPQLAEILAQPGMRILLALVAFLPFLGMLYGALQLLFGFKSPKWHPGLVIFVLWLLAIIAFGIVVATGFISAEMLTV